MKSSIILLSTLASYGVVAAIEPRSFNLPLNRRAPLVQTVEEREIHLESRLERIKRKYNVVEPRSTHKGYKGYKRKSKRTTGVIQMGDALSDTSYSATITLGTPPVAFEVSLDTGSADLVIVTAPCASGCTSDTPLYQPHSSSTSLVSITPFNIAYQAGGASGVLVSDVMGFGGYSVQSQTFAAANVSSTIVGAGGVNGLLGLGNQPLATSQAIPFVQALYISGQLPQPLFAFAFARWGSQATGMHPGGTMNVGSLDTAFFSGSINYVSITNEAIKEGYWLVPMDDITVGGVSTKIQSTGANIDTGTTNILIPYAAANTIYAQIAGSASNGKGTYTYYCNANPTLSFSFGGIFYSMSSADFNGGYASEDGVHCFGAVNGIGPGPGGADVFIIGDAFLKNVYSVFRFYPFAVGFAPLVDTNGLVEAGSVPVGNGTDSLGVMVAQPVTASITGSTSASGIGGLAQVLQNAVTATIAANVKNGVLSITCVYPHTINKSADIWTCTQ